MDTPVRKYQKQKDYQRHKLFRKMKRRRRAAIEQAKDAPMKQLRRKLKIPKFEDGKDENKELPYPLRSSKDYDDNLAYRSGIIRDPKTGHMWSTTQEEYPNRRTYLKRPNHPTFNKALWGDLISGYDVYFKNGNTYSAPTFSELMYIKPPFKFNVPKFEDGKDESTQKMKIPVTTGGAGYIPDYSTHNSVEGLKKAVYDYYTGGLPVEEVRNRLYNNVSPYGYFDVSHRIRSAVINNIPFKKSDNTGYFEDLRKGKDPKIDSRGYSPKRDDIFAEYLQIPKNKRHSFPNDSGVKLIKSKYAPTIGKENNSYLALRLPDNYKESLVRAGENVLMGKNQLFVTKPLGDFLGEHTVGKGYDSKGEYISYYDKWDLDPFFYRQGERDITMGIGKPVNIYDRIYLDDYYGVKQPTHATYLPEVTVYGKKKKGSTFNKGKDSGIHIKPENRGKFNALKKRTGKTTEQLTHSKNPLTRKRAIFAQNAKKWKH